MRINRLFNKTNSAVRESKDSLTKKSLQPEKLQFLMLQTCFCIRINGLSCCRLVFVFSYVGRCNESGPMVYAFVLPPIKPH